MPVVSVAAPGFRKERQSSAGSLEYRSKLPAQEGEAFVRLFPTAGEATATVIPWWLQLAGSKRAPATRSATPRQQRANGKRAAAHVRRFIRANGLEYLWTGTYAEAPDERAQVVRDVRRFLERLQRAFGRMPVVVVIERGSKRGRLHVHFAVERWLPHERVTELWGHGFTWVGDPGKVGARTGARKLAAYLSKYVTKDVAAEGGDEAPPERGAAHRYAVTEGWAPEERRFVAWDLPRALEHLAGTYGVADRLVEWTDEALPGVYGVWLSYPDGVIASWHPPP